MTSLVTPNLTTDLVADPGLRRLGLMVSDAGIDVAITSRVHDNELIYRHIPYPANAESTLAGLEEVIYDNPLLTADFARVDALLDTRRFFIVSADDAGDETVKSRVELLYPRLHTDFDIEIVNNNTDTDKVRVITVADRNVVRFLRRTFNNPPVVHRMAALTRYYGLRSHLGNSGKVHVRIQQQRTDIMAFGHNGLLMANTFDTTCADDAMFYTLAAIRRLGYDNDTDRIFVSGDRRLRDAFVSGIRRFVTYAMPEIFPAALTSLGDGVYNVPFEILVSPLTD